MDRASREFEQSARDAVLGLILKSLDWGTNGA
jgi:hypothetical protein